jgi:DNA polymerase-3 subunit beta
MQFTIHKPRILNVLQKMQGLTGRSTSLDITRNVLITAGAEKITMAATDLETGFEGSYSAAVQSEGVVAINARKLLEIVRDFPDDDIHFGELENQWVEIGNDKVHYQIVCANALDFPELQRFEDVTYLNIDSSALKKMIERILMISGDPNDGRAHINSVLFEKISTEEKNLIRMVSTDGSRLALTEAIIDEQPEFVGESVLVPKKELNEVVKFLSPEGSVKVSIKNNYLIFRKDSEVISVRLAEGKFPDYHQILNREGDNCLKAKRQSLLMMLKRMSILSTDDYKGAIFSFSQNQLKVTTTNPEIGESKEDLEIEFDSEPIEISFNPKYFVESLTEIEDETVIAKIVDYEKPCLLQGENDKTFLSAIMPMRT